MADAKISALTALTAPASGDFFAIDDISDTTQAASGTAKRITYANVFASIPVDASFTANTTLGDASGDTLTVNATATFAANASFNANTTLGDASGDTLTINAGTWTLGSNYTATRAAGALAAGAVSVQAITTTYSGDSGGTTDARGMTFTATSSGTANMTAAESLRSLMTVSNSSGTVTAGRAVSGLVTVGGAGAVTNANVFSSTLTLSSSGNVTAGRNFIANAPTLSSTGTVGTMTGFLAGDQGDATLVTNAIGFDAANQTVSATLTAGFRSLQNSGTGAWGFFHNGTANNAFKGPVRIGSVTAPTAGIELDVTGDVQISGNVGFYGTAAAARPSAYTQTYSTASRTHAAVTASNPPAGGTGATAGAYDTAANRNAMITSLTNTIADVANVKQVLNSVIDDLQTLGLLQ